MTTTKLLHSFRTLLALICFALCLSPYSVRGEVLENEDAAELFNAFQTEYSTASRAPKPLSQTAENVSVITAEEIRLLNAHTLADVLVTIPGIQTDPRGAVGNLVNVSIQSSSNQHLLVLIDGVPLNTLGENFSDTGLVPATIIERIEIIKGAASSSWGQALGGVISVITRAPSGNRAIGGSATASIGTSVTSNDRADLYGTSDRLGYYISGGYLGTKGMTPNSNVSAQGVFTKLTWTLSEQGLLWSTFKYDRAERGVFWGGSIWDNKVDQAQRNISASIGVHKPLTDNLELELLGRYAARRQDSISAAITDNAITQNINARELASGASAKLVWRGNDNLLVIGGDYEHADINANDTLVHVDTLNRIVNRWGVYLNDTATFGSVSIIPGVRFDRIVTSSDQISPSIGAVWQLTDTTLLRGYTANGFSLPSVLYDRQPEKVWTSQVGIESSAIPYLWLKTTLFRNELKNVQNLRNVNFDPVTGAPVAETRIAKGAELEIRTIPFYSTSLGAGYTFTDSIHAGNGSRVYADPRHTVQLALRYDDTIYRGVLTGRHVNWNSVPGYGGRYGGLIWDLHLGATLLKREHSSMELFFSGHNLFNGKQYQDEMAPNAGRWFDGGLRVNF